jgi:putative cardiolipin synthase
MFGKSLGRLHAKTAVIDRHLVFVGSMNLDPRSASANTELGMFIDSPALAKELLRVVNISRLESAYRVRLDPKTQQLQWLTMDGDKEVVLVVEPESSFWLRVHNALMGWFVPSSCSRGSHPRARRGTIRACPDRPALAAALAALASAARPTRSRCAS